jgi:hypothetical protein
MSSEKEGKAYVCFSNKDELNKAEKLHALFKTVVKVERYRFDFGKKPTKSSRITQVTVSVPSLTLSKFQITPPPKRRTGNLNSSKAAATTVSYFGSLLSLNHSLYSSLTHLHQIS